MLDNGDKDCIKFIGCYYHTWTKLQNPSHDLQAPLDLTLLIFRARFFYYPHSPLFIRPFPSALVLCLLPFPAWNIPHVLPQVYSFWPCCMAWGIFVPRPGIKHMPPVAEAWSLKHWTTREVSPRFILISVHCCLIREYDSDQLLI